MADADARRRAEATARYLLGVADETRLGEFESELVDCIRALLAAVPETPPPPSDAVREAAERLHPYADWHEDDGPVLWYPVPVEEPPYCGDPLCSDWPNEWNAPYDTVTGAFVDGPYTGKVLMWQRLPGLPPGAARGAKGGE